MAAMIYIHGFNSSSKSTKASILSRSLDHFNLSSSQYYAPDLGYDPEQAIHLLCDLINQLKSDNTDVYLVGSSLGGFYATYLAEEFGLKAVLINPAVKPYELLVDYIGENQNIYTGEVYTITQQHMDQLKRLDVNTIRDPSKFLLLAQTNDETLDYHQAADKFYQSPSVIEFGGSHGFDHFESKLPVMSNFLLGAA